jgi:uncharacterized membrane protein (UPF0136 family)
MVTFRPQAALIRLDFPTFGRPTKLTKPLRIPYHATVCQNRIMLDRRKWLDRMQPQTLQIATWILYINAFFALVELVDGGGVLHYFRNRYAFGFFFGIIVIAAYVIGGFLMANERKLGWQISVAAAVSPFILTFVAYSEIGASLRFRILGGSLLSFAFDVALLALLLHRQSREHQRIWYH